MTLNELIAHFDRLFGGRDRLFFPTMPDQIGLLQIRIGDLQNLVRKTEVVRDPRYEIPLRRIFVRFCGLVNFYRIDLAEHMARKFPLSGCGYCLQMPCICVEEERDQHSAVPTEQDYQLQITWPLTQWSQHLRSMYGNSQVNQSLNQITLRLYREVSELTAAISGARTSSKSNQEIYKEIGLEMADILAWTIAAAILSGVDLETAIWSHYGQGCVRCHQIPCICKPFHIKPMEWTDDGFRHMSTP